MEQHPVPQNVTTFQFRLVGDMTIKQFGYLAGGAIASYICIKLPLPFFFTWPLAAAFLFGGIGFAFVPIEERPMDVWVLSFLKSIYSPTEYVWQRLPPKPPSAPRIPETDKPQPSQAAVKAGASSQAPRPAMQDLFSGLRIHSVHVGGPMSWLRRFVKGPGPGSPLGHPEPARGLFDRRVGPIRHSQPVPLPQVKEEPPASGEPSPGAHILELQKQLTEALQHKQKMEEELSLLRRKVAAPAKAGPPPTPAGVSTAGKTSQPTVKVMSPETAVKAGLPRMTTFPNVTTGIIKDPEGNLLPGILITVRDKDDVPLRALKTNKLGQFAASTPLPPGTYVVEIEDPRGRFVFDRAQIVVNDTILPALEIVARSKKELERQRLAQQVFGKIE